MPESSGIWGEKEWQAYANALLSTHYAMNNGSYQRIPDKGGDGGLEGITRCGCAYQCYADQESKTHEDRTRKQKKKILDDLNKLEKNKDFWITFLGTTKIRHWTLMVPNLDDKEVVSYARKRARELLKKKLPFIEEKFEAFVKTADDYPAAKLVARDPRLPAASGNVSPKDLAAFKQKEAVFVQRIDGKLKRVPAKNDADRVKFREQLLHYHLQSSNYLEELRQKFPPQWEEFDSLVDGLGTSISTEAFMDNRSPDQRLMEIRKSFEKMLDESHRFIAKNERILLSWGTVSKWLGECPLDFPEAKP
ncbi:MAG: hypothetical protein U1D30_10965 [Planctomycetota bacterium]